MTSDSKKSKRSCIACGKQDSKVALHRIVRSPQGVASFDISGKAPGRGAYVCSVECFATARKTKKLERALKMSLGQDEYDRIAGDVSRRCAKLEGIEE